MEIHWVKHKRRPPGLQVGTTPTAMGQALSERRLTPLAPEGRNLPRRNGLGLVATQRCQPPDGWDVAKQTHRTIGTAVEARTTNR